MNADERTQMKKAEGLAFIILPSAFINIRLTKDQETATSSMSAALPLRLIILFLRARLRFLRCFTAGPFGKGD
jgi:hypothetical protein